jgi:hypothetical protein
VAAPARAHARQHAPGHGHQAEEVRLEHRPHLLLLAFLDRGQVAVAGVVHQHVDAAEGALRLLHRGVHLRRIGDVEAKREAVLRVRCDDVPDLIRIARRRHGFVSMRQGAQSDGSAQPGRAAGDEPDGCGLAGG